MTNNPYKGVDKEIVDKLSFKHSACSYVYHSDKDGFQKGVLYETDNDSYKSILNILKGDYAVDLVKGDKLFLLPGHPLAQVRVKEYLKSIGASLTNDITKATVIGGGDDFYEKLQLYSNRKNQARLTNLMFKTDEINHIFKHENINNDLDYLFDIIDTDGTLKEDFENGIECIVSKKAMYKSGHYVNLCSINDKYYITPAGMNIIYHILSKKLKVVTAENVCDKANSGLKMEDDDTYMSIYQMLDSNDSANINLGVNILVHCDLSGDSLLNIYKLAKNFHNVVYSHRYSKNLTYFRQRTNWDELAYMHEQAFLNYAKEQDKLTGKMIRELIPEVYHNLLTRSPITDDNNFFDLIEDGEMGYKITLKEVWKEELKNEMV